MKSKNVAKLIGLGLVVGFIPACLLAIAAIL